MRPRYQDPGAPSHDELRRHTAPVHLRRVLCRHAAVTWTGKNPEVVAEIRSLSLVTDANHLDLWKAGVPLSLPLMERVRSVMCDPHHEPEFVPGRLVAPRPPPTDGGALPVSVSSTASAQPRRR